MPNRQPISVLLVW